MDARFARFGRRLRRSAARLLLVVHAHLHARARREIALWHYGLLTRRRLTRPEETVKRRGRVD